MMPTPISPLPSHNTVLANSLQIPQKQKLKGNLIPTIIIVVVAKFNRQGRWEAWTTVDSERKETAKLWPW